MLPALLSSLNGIVFSRLVFGVCEAAIMTCCSTLIADYWHGHERSRFVNLQVVSIGFVGAIFFIVGGALGEHSWRMPFYLYLLPLLLVPFMIKILWEPITQHIPQPHSQSESQQINLAALLANYLLIFGGMVLAFVVPVQTPALLVQTGVTSSTLIGLSAGVGLLASLVGSLLWPLLRGQFGIMSVNVLLLSLAGIGLWLLVHATGYPHILVAVFIHGVGIGMLVPNTMLPVMNALSEKHRGKGMGVFTGCLYIGQFVSPLIVATLAGLTQGLVGAIQILSIASFGGALLWLVCDLIKRVHRVIINR